MSKTEGLKNLRVHTQYRLKDGTRVPGVTTVLGILNKPALVSWAWNLGISGVDYRKYRDATAEIGTLAHAMIANDLGAEAPDLSAYSQETIDRAENALISYYEWKKTQSIEPVMIEKPLVSERYRYGGTLDGLVYLNGKLTLFDIKTSKAIYPEMLHQLAAYWMLLKEHDYSVRVAQILRVGRDENEGFDTRKVVKFKPHWEVFHHCLQIHTLQKQIRKEVG